MVKPADRDSTGLLIRHGNSRRCVVSSHEKLNACDTSLIDGDCRIKAERKDVSHAGCKSRPRIHHVGVIWFRQAMKDTENTGMIPPYGSKTRTDEDEIYGELKAA